MTILLPTAEETEAFGLRLAAALRRGDAVALFGALGTGKTTLARGVLRGLGYQGEVASPTFPIVQIYEPPDTRLSVWHVDLYRIEDSAELEELALEDGRSGAVLLVEWPERLGTALWPHALRLRLTGGGEGPRALTAEVPTAWGDRWPPR